jgi:periplasmic protein CpxP/Spy
MNKLASRFALLGLALSAVSLPPTAFAQDNPPSMSPGNAPPSASQHAAPDPQKQAARLAKKLGLNDDQSAKITAIMQDRQQQLTATRGDTSLSPQDRRAKMRSIQQGADSQINAVLSPDQQKQYATMKQNMMNRRQNGHGGSASPSGSNSDSDSNGN